MIDGYNTGAGRTITYDWDVEGQKTGVTYPVSGDAIAYTLDALDRVDVISRASVQVVDYAFNGRRVIKKTYPGSHGKSTYDGYGRLTQILHEDASSGNDLAKFVYGYDRSHQVTSQDKFYYDDVQNTRILAATSDKGEQYAYDGAKRLATVLRGVPTAKIDTALGTNITNGDYDDKVEYHYDPTGNRTTREIDDVDDETYGYNKVNEMTTEGASTLTYDANGNFTGTSNTHEYTFENQYGSYAGTDTWTYHYDALGRMVQRENNAIPVVAHRYYYDGVEAIEQNDWNDAAGTEAADKLFVYGERIDELLEYVDISANPDKRYYAHTDKLGSVHVLVNETGSIAESYRYKEFGETTTVDNSFTKLNTNTSPVGNPYRYTARRADLEAGSYGDDWYHYRARVMRPGAGRFVQRDPIGHGDGSNLYVYVRNRPVNYSDPTGTFTLLDDGGGYPPGWCPGCRLPHLPGGELEGPPIAPPVMPPPNPCDPPPAGSCSVVGLPPGICGIEENKDKPGVNKCCCEHDQCYANGDSSSPTAGEDKAACDLAFGKCLIDKEQGGMDPSDAFCWYLAVLNYANKPFGKPKPPTPPK